MYGPPRDQVGLDAFASELAKAYQDVEKDPEYAKLPLAPLKFSQSEVDSRAMADQDLASGRVARSCLWAQQFGPGTKLSIDLAGGAGSKWYRARAMDEQNRVVGDHSAWSASDFDENDSVSASTAPDRLSPGSNAGTLPVRYLSSRVAGRSVDWYSDAGAPAAPLAPSDEIFSPRRAASYQRGPQRVARLPGLVSGEPMQHLLPPSIFDLHETGTPGDEDWLLRLLAPRGRR